MVYVLKRMQPKAALRELPESEIADIMAKRKKIMESAGLKRVSGHYKSFNDDPQLAEAEVQAKRDQLGLWADETPIPPWEWRKRKKQPAVP